MKHLYLLTLFLCLGINNSAAQQITQTVRGTVTDKISNAPIIGAQVYISSAELGAKTNDNGEFEIKQVPIGRIKLRVSIIGYNPIFLNNVELNSTNELILSLKMEEKVYKSKVVKIRAKRDKAKTNNELVMVSGRTFSVEETQRYAGSRNDVARMAQSFAGVQGADDSRNDIIVRGNSPVGVLYRLEGMDIPNPNHFAAAGTTGGPVSMLNNNVLSNSDFITSAFPAEYMNASSGVFDLRLRKGNDRKHEFLGQIGFNGAELNAEGPITKNGNNSYIVGYRYSTLGIFKELGIDFGAGTAVPAYQDGSFKLNFSDKNGHTTLFGIGGQSNVKLYDSENDGPSLFGDAGQDFDYKTKTGIIGLSRMTILSKKSFLKATIGIQASSTETILDTFTIDPLLDKAPFYRDHSSQGAISLNSFYQTKFSARSNFKAGFYADRNFFNLHDSVYRAPLDSFVNLTNFDGALWVLKPYAQYQYKFSEDLSVTAGLSSVFMLLNNSYSLEPRGGIKYNISPKSSLALGYGLHSKIAPFRTFFEESEVSPGVYSTTNENIGLSKAHHLVLGFDHMLAQNKRIKIETYYQHLYNIPIDSRVSTYSLLNQGADFGIGLIDSMVNKGTGRNYGIEFTLEQFMTKGFYYLVTASLYNSTYVPSDGMRYSTAFNGGYAFNVLGGKEFLLKEQTNGEGRTKRYSLTTDFKSLLNGGKRYTPVDSIQSQLAGEVVFDQSQTFASQFKDYFRIDFRIGFKIQSKKVSHEWAFDIQNITNRQNIFSAQYDLNTGELQESYQTGFFPVVQYRIRF